MTERIDAARSIIAAFPIPRVALIQATYQAEGRVHLQSPAAHVWRGQLGEYLHRTAPQRHHNSNLSLYQRLFRTPRSAVQLPEGLSGHMKGRLGIAGTHVPHPFVLRMTDPPVPGRDLIVGDGEEVSVDLVLVEEAVQTLPSLAGALEQLGRYGLGSKSPRQGNASRQRGTVRLQRAALSFPHATGESATGGSSSAPPASAQPVSIGPDAPPPRPKLHPSASESPQPAASAPASSTSASSTSAPPASDSSGPARSPYETGKPRTLFDGTHWHFPDLSEPVFADVFTEALADAPARSRHQEPLQDRPQECFEHLVLELWTPLRLQHGGGLVRPEEMSIAALASACFRRLAGLAACYRPEAVSAPAMSALLSAFHALGDATRLARTDLRWIRDSRFSSAQGERHPTGGLFGTVTLQASAPVLRVWARLFRSAERLHLGKTTSMGLGRIRVRL